MKINKIRSIDFKIPILLLVFVLISILSYAQTEDKIYLWPNKVPGETEEKHEPLQTENISGNVIRLTNVTDPALIVYKASEQNNTGAAVIICPGGGYSLLAMNKEGSEIGEWFNKHGYTAFVLQYRVPNKEQGALNDIQRAIRIVRSNARKYNINPCRIGVIGFSAGASLSALASTNFDNVTYPKSDDIDNLSCRPDFAMLIYPAYLDKGEERSLTPELTITDKTPPFFIFGTADDFYGNSSLVMAAALRDNNIPVELHLLSKGGHGYGLRPGNSAADAWPSLAHSWLMKWILQADTYTQKNL